MTDSLTAISQRAESALWNALLPGAPTLSKPAAVAKQGGRKPTLSSAYRARLLELLKSLNDDEGQVSSQTIWWLVERGHFVERGWFPQIVLWRQPPLPHPLLAVP